jgi:flagellar biosynthetic protein FliQ
MDPVAFASDTGRHALQMAIMLSLPVLLTGLTVGVIISVLQAATQVQEQTLSFIPKIIAMLGALYLFMPMLIRMIVDYSQGTFLGIADIPF